MTSHENIHQRVFVRTAENRLFAVCHAFKIDRNAVQITGVIQSDKVFIHSNNFWYPFEKSFYLLGQQRFSIQNSKQFNLSNSRGFPYSKGNPIRVSSVFVTL